VPSDQASEEPEEPEALEGPGALAEPAVPTDPELPRLFVPKHERPRPGQAPEDNDGDSVAAAEELGW
jgi:hypothetical protein